MTIDFSAMNTTPDMPQVKRDIVSIGAGGIVTDSHLPAYREAGFNVQAIYDIDGAKAQAVASAFNIPRVCSTLPELIECGIAHHAVFDIAVPASEIKLILPLLPANAGVLIQKPMGESIEEAREILRICHQKPLIAGINFQLRRAPFMIAAKQIVDSGQLGYIHDVDMRVVCHPPWN